MTTSTLDLLMGELNYKLTSDFYIVFRFFTLLILCDLREERGMDLEKKLYVLSQCQGVLLGYLASARTQPLHQGLTVDTEVKQIMGKQQ